MKRHDVRWSFSSGSLTTVYIYSSKRTARKRPSYIMGKFFTCHISLHISMMSIYEELPRAKKIKTGNSQSQYKMKLWKKRRNYKITRKQTERSQNTFKQTKFTSNPNIMNMFLYHFNIRYINLTCIRKYC